MTPASSTNARRTRARGLRHPVWWLVLVLVVVLVGCDSTEKTRIGACPIKPGAACSGNYMRGAALSMSGLFDADFDHADLTDIDLHGADLSGATMVDARLTRANLAHATLSYADLSGADLRHANLTGADLTGANLTGARVTPAQLAHTTICRTAMVDGTIAAPDC